MNTTFRTAQLSAAAANPLRTALRTGNLLPLRVDEQAGVIFGAALMSVGPAEGHGWHIDATTLAEAEQMIADQADGAALRFTHPKTDASTGQPVDAIGTTLGVVRNPRVEGGVLRGDLHFGSYASTVPGYGDLRSYLIRMARETPTKLGLSPQILYRLEPVNGLPTARLGAVEAVDFVDRPASNRHGLLSVPPIPVPPPTGMLPSGTTPPQKGVLVDFITYLVSLGLTANATPEQTASFFAGLTAEQQAEARTKFPTETAQLSAEKPGETKPAGPPAAPAAPAAGQLRAVAAVTLPAEDPFVREQLRAAGLRQLATAYDLGTDFVSAQLQSGATPEQSIAAARAALATRRPLPNVQVGDDRGVSTIGAAIGDALMIRGGLSVAKPHERAQQFVGMNGREITRAYLTAIGVDVSGMTAAGICELVFNRAKLASLGRAQLMHTPGDFSNILADTIGKSVRTGFDLAETTYESWVRKTTAPDFKPITRVQLSEGPGLRRVKKGGEYPDVKLSDASESYQLAKYGYVLTISWETFLNDDKDVFGRIPQIMGQDAKQLEDDLAYLVLLQNAALKDTIALFHASHGNLAASGAAPSTATLNAMVAAMTKQQGLNKRTLNIRPATIITPTELEASTWELLNSTSNPVSSNANVKNRYGPGGAVKLNHVSTAKLSNGIVMYDEDGKEIANVAGNATAWFGLANNSQIDTVEVANLESESSPVTTEQDGFRVDGRSFKIRHTAAAAAIDYRGTYKNPGV